jgi:hypothetical protein
MYTDPPDPVQGAIVSLYRDDKQKTYDITGVAADSKGTATFDNLEPSEYFVKVYYPPIPSSRGQAYVNLSAGDTSITVDLYYDTYRKVPGQYKIWDVYHPEPRAVFHDKIMKTILIPGLPFVPYHRSYEEIQAELGKNEIIIEGATIDKLIRRINEKREEIRQKHAPNEVEFSDPKITINWARPPTEEDHSDPHYVLQTLRGKGSAVCDYIVWELEPNPVEKS